ncbi:MAG: 16S rRNA (adenine(1518)-N(6)/adenine(1519)-N(6))-dimethyltransferase RsmA [Candidatus Micrarchaeia archaeon]
MKPAPANNLNSGQCKYPVHDESMASKRTQILGQNMLVDSRVIEYEVAMARPEGMAVLEIGGGTGNLTAALLEKAKKVVTVEKDPEMAEELRVRFKGMKNLEIVEGDFLSLNPDEYRMSKIDIIVGNIPYSASSPIIFRLREWSFRHAVLCVQKEFAERMVAKPGDRNYSRLSVMVQIYFIAKYLKTVPAGCFRPVPEVDSAIVMLFPKGVQVDRARDIFITKLFVHRKKILSAALGSREFTSDERKSIAEKAGQAGLLKKRIFSLTPAEISTLL